MTKFNENNFFGGTTAVFTLCEQPQSEPDFVSGSGSAYWYINGGVVRRADHWGYGIASCNWYLRELDMSFYSSADLSVMLDTFGELDVCAFCKFDSFRDNIEFRVEFEARKREVQFRVNPFFDE